MQGLALRTLGRELPNGSGLVSPVNSTPRQAIGAPDASERVGADTLVGWDTSTDRSWFIFKIFLDQAEKRVRTKENGINFNFIEFQYFLMRFSLLQSSDLPLLPKNRLDDEK